MAVSHLHRNGYLHRDIALRNFLVSHEDVEHKDQHLVIADFGLSRSLLRVSIFELKIARRWKLILR